MKEILHNAIDTVLEEPFYQFTTQPKGVLNKLLLKWGFRKPKVYTLQHLTAGNAYRVSKRILEIPEASIKEGTDAIIRDMFKLHTGHLDTLAYIVAISITNSRQEPPQSLIDELMWGVSEVQLREAAKAVVNNFDVKNFTLTIVSIVGMDIISPMQTSPTVPGASLEESSSTSG